MTTSLEQAKSLQDKLINALGDVVDLVTLDGIGVKSQTRAAVVLAPPEIEFTTFSERDTVFKLYATAGPAANPVLAWERLDQIINALETAQINMKSAVPATFDLAGSGTLPCYEITLHPF